MPRLPRIPAYRRHKPTGQAVVTLGGRDFYLGRYGTAESPRRYDRLLAEWIAAGRPVHINQQVEALTITELIARFWRHATSHYRRPDGTPTSELHCYRPVLGALQRLYGAVPASDFSRLKLKALRQTMIDAGLSRSTINGNICRVRHVFKWAAANELVPPSTYHGLQAVAGLQRGRCDAPETEPVKPVPNEHVDAIRPYVSPQVWAMVELQRLTGMRPGEVVFMRTADLETGGRLWVYRPAHHKTEHHGHKRTVYLGPRAQKVLKPWLRTNLAEYLFRPDEAEDERNAKRRQDRKTPLWPSHVKAQRRKRKRRPKRRPRDRYDTASYRRAIARACQRAGVPAWSPHRLRHTAATRLRKEFGIEAARVVLGHRSPLVTEIYAEIDRQKAAEVMARIG